MFRLLLIPAALIALLCGAMVLSRTVSQKKADFTYIIPEEVHTLDTNTMSYSQDFRVCYGLFEGLYRADPKTFEAVPGTADPIDVSPDKTVFTFHIRPDARWSNGDPVLADNFVFAWRRMLEEPREYSYLLYYISGAQAYEEAFQEDEKAFEKIKSRNGKKTPIFTKSNFDTVGIKKLDDRTLRCILTHPVVPFPDLVAMPPFFPQNQKAMEPFLDQTVFKESEGHIRRYNKDFTTAPNLVSNGPYYLESWVYKRQMRLRKNPYYYDNKNAICNTIDQVVAPDDQWGYAMFASGGADWYPAFTGEIASELYKKRDPVCHVSPAFGTYFYSFNCQPTFKDGSKNPFSDKRVRQALGMAIDKNVIVDQITRTGQIPTTTYVPENYFKGYPSPKGLPYDVEAAKKLLADAGYPGGAGFPNVSLLLTNVAPHAQIGENIRRQWLEKLGIDIKIDAVEGKTSGDRQRNHDYAVCRAGWYGDYFDPSTFTDKYKPHSDNNESGWVNADYVKWCDKADVEPDPQTRLNYYAKAEGVLLTDAPIVPIYTYSTCALIGKDVYGIYPNPRAMVILSTVGVKH